MIYIQNLSNYVQSPSVSVVIPVHNKATYVKRAISSVLNQTFSNFEIIVIEDASTDNSAQIVKSIKDYRIRFLSRDKPGSGGYAARNLGIKMAKSEWIAFLDADDAWEPNFLNCIFELSRTFPNSGMLSCGWRIADKDQLFVDNYYKFNKNEGSHVYNLKSYISNSRPICTSVAVIKKSILMQLNGFNEEYKHGADTDLWLRVLLAGNTGAWYPIIGATYFRNVVNKVTDNLCQIESPCAVSIDNFLVKNPCHPFASELKSYSEKIRLRPILRTLAYNSNILNIDSIRCKFSWNSKKGFIVKVLTYLPDVFRTSISSSWYKRITKNG